MICLSISLDASVSNPAFVGLVCAMPCRAEPATFLLNRPGDVIALLISCSSSFPNVVAVLEPNVSFIFWNMVGIGSHALFISIHFGTSMLWHGSFDAVVLNELFLCILAISPCHVVCV